MVGQKRIEFTISPIKGAKFKTIGFNIKQVEFNTKEEAQLELYYRIINNKRIKLYIKDHNYDS